MLHESRAALWRAVDDRDLLGRDAGAEQLEHLGGGQLGLGQLAPGLEQADRPARIDPARVYPILPRLEQPALEVVQGDAGLGRVVLVGRRQLEHTLGQGAELLDHLGPGRQCRSARLVGERHHDLHADDPGERLDRIPLERVQVVEPVEEHGLAAPAVRRRAQRVERPPGVQLAVDAAELIEARGVGAVGRGDIAGVRAPARVLLGPGSHSRGEPLRRDERALQLRDQLAGCVREPLGECGLPQGVELDAAQRFFQHPLALERTQPPTGVSDPVGDLPSQPAKRQDRPEHRSLGGQLAGVVARVSRRRDDQDRAAMGRGGERARVPPRLWRSWRVPGQGLAASSPSAAQLRRGDFGP